MKSTPQLERMEMNKMVPPEKIEENKEEDMRSEFFQTGPPGNEQKPVPRDGTKNSRISIYSSHTVQDDV